MFTVSLVNTRTTQSIDAQYTPPALREKVSAAFTALEVLGYSHQPQQFKYTAGYRIEGIEFRYDARSSKRGFTREMVEEARKFFLSLQYAPSNGQDVISGGPDVCLLLWANLFTLAGYVVLDEIDHRSAENDGSIQRFAARFSFVAVSADRLTQEDVLANGVSGGAGALDRLAGG